MRGFRGQVARIGVRMLRVYKLAQEAIFTAPLVLS
jgi:hypothetical protein